MTAGAFLLAGAVLGLRPEEGPRPVSGPAAGRPQGHDDPPPGFVGTAHPPAASSDVRSSSRRQVVPAGPHIARGPVVRATRVLRGWDDRRAAAYAQGDVAALRRLYRGSAGAADVRLLRGYLARGFRVEQLRTQLLAVRVLAHDADTLLARVTDRVAHAVAVRPGQRTVLPRDQPDSRRVRLVRTAGRWQVAQVRPVSG